MHTSSSSTPPSSRADADVEQLSKDAQTSLSIVNAENALDETIAHPDVAETTVNKDGASSSSSSSSLSPSQSFASASPTTTDVHTSRNAIGSGGGGPPVRLSASNASADTSNTSPGLRPSGSGRMGSGGPPPLTSRGSSGPGTPRSSANEMARQMASTRLPPGLQARLAANVNRSSSSSGASSPANPTSFNNIGADHRLDMASFLGSPSALPGASSGQGSFRAPAGLRPAPGLPPGAKAPSNAVGGGLGNRRKGPGLKLSDIASGDSDGVTAGGTGPNPKQGQSTNGSIPPGRRLAPPGKLASAGKGLMSSAFDMHKNIVDPSGRLRFDGKAVLSASGVEFRNGTSFQINMDDFDLLDELGKGAYGTVRKVRHTKTGVEMAMKEIRLELDDSKLNGIIMELDILHRATAPEIVEFYGAFFYESCVYYCIEVMDAGSLENLYDGPCSVPEDVLARIVGCMVRGLRFLKDNLQIMHRDVKPTNVLLNKRGEVKLCDFGVSGQLEKSLAKTNIGCQSYMAPERIKGESQNLVGTYTVASDVWSLGLSIVETTMGTYPYPPETYSNVFAQLQAIVHGDPPQLPGNFYSDIARDFVAGCLEKLPAKRSTYKQMLEHAWLVNDRERGPNGVDMKSWIAVALERKAARREKERREAVIE